MWLAEHHSEETGEGRWRAGGDPARAGVPPKGSRRKKRIASSIRQVSRLHAFVYASDVEDRVGGALVAASLFGVYPSPLEPYRRNSGVP